MAQPISWLFAFFRFLPPPAQSTILIETLLSEFISSNSHSDQHLASFPKALLRQKYESLWTARPESARSYLLRGPCLGPPKAFPIPKDISKPAPLGSSLFLFYLTLRSPFLAIPTKKGITHSVPDLKQLFVPACRLRPR